MFADGVAVHSFEGEVESVRLCSLDTVEDTESDADISLVIVLVGEGVGIKLTVVESSSDGDPVLESSCDKLPEEEREYVDEALLDLLSSEDKE